MKQVPFLKHGDLFKVDQMSSEHLNIFLDLDISTGVANKEFTLDGNREKALSKIKSE